MAVTGNVVVYTAIFGSYDTLRDPIGLEKDVTYHCFTDITPPSDGIWQMHYQELEQRSNVRAARYRKIMAHKFLPDADYSMWIDGNIQLINPRTRAKCFSYLGDADIALFKHAERDCVVQEAAANIVLGKDFPSNIHRQIQHYFNKGYLEHNGMVETNILLRRHTKSVQEFNEAWWDELEQHTHRDQLSFNYVAWKLGMRYNTFGGGVPRLGQCNWARYYSHG